ncbi:MAG TPA: NAD(P)H-binding protein [Aggregatilineales bacterium]|jgi:NADH dehydrogenase|nr:NAD(P)H-binding protein [Aggregatilineales bacterium]
MILVTGATGFIGRHLVTELVARGHVVRLLVPPQRLKHVTWDREKVEVIEGTLQDEEAVYRAVSGVHVIYHLENALWWGRPRNLQRVELVGTRSLATSARSARVGRIITLSQLGASPASAYTLMKIKGQVEEMVRSSGLAYTIIRSGVVFGEDDAFINHIGMMLASNPLFFLMPGRGEIVLHPIYIDDLVQILINALSAIDTVDTTIEVGGAEYTTLRDLILTVMRVTGQNRVIVPVPPYAMRWFSTIYGRLLPRTLITPQWLDLLATNRTARLGNAYDYFRVRPRRFEDTLMTYLPKKRFLRLALRHVFRRRPREA